MDKIIFWSLIGLLAWSFIFAATEKKIAEKSIQRQMLWHAYWDAKMSGWGGIQNTNTWRGNTL